MNDPTHRHVANWLCGLPECPWIIDAFNRRLPPEDAAVALAPHLATVARVHDPDSCDHWVNWLHDVIPVIDWVIVAKIILGVS